MKFRTHGYRFADDLYERNEAFSEEWSEIVEAIKSIKDEEIITEFENEKRKAKSISQALNRLIKARLVDYKWKSESYIFADEDYAKRTKGTWRLDFAKKNISVEVAFNHRSDILWNLMKPTLASELNHVDKALQTQGGVIIAATENLKSACGFDSAVGTYEDYVQYLKPLSLKLTTPLLIVGLEPPETFRIDVEQVSKGSKKYGIVRRLAASDGSYWLCPECGGKVSSGLNNCTCGRRLMYAWPDQKTGYVCSVE
jgi:hypothetical protein